MNDLKNGSLCASLGKKSDKLPFTCDQVCGVRANHLLASKLFLTDDYQLYKPPRSFVFSFVRHPAKRAISDIFYFRSKQKGFRMTDNYILKRLTESGHDGFQIRYLSPVHIPVANKTLLFLKSGVRHIMSFYDFIGVVERMEESLVALKMLLNLDHRDILHVNAKNSSVAYDPIAQEKRLSHNNLSPAIKNYLANEFVEKNRYDFKLYEKVNQALDNTIRSLNATEFAHNLAVHKYLMMKATALCIHSTVCYWRDNGCGFECLDSLVLNSSSLL